MRLTLYTDYSMRVLIYLGQRRDQLVTIGEIAAYYGISRNHLMKVVHQLGTWGYIETLRGKGGGIRLAHAPERINLGEVVRLTEENMDIVECFTADASRCIIEPVCVLKNVLEKALDNFLATLDLYTLADLLQGPLPAFPSLADHPPGDADTPARTLRTRE
jgi:Rrf2 family nitric oxide-sensitive transcriptional repressor